MKKIFAIASVALLSACTISGAPSNRTPAGNPNADVVVVEYFDLQCPACKSAHETITKPMLEQYGEKVRYEVRHFPLQSIHPFALEAAMGSECAADQGKFWEYVDLAFINQSELSTQSIKDWAQELNLNTEVFNECFESNEKRGTVLADFQEGRNREVQGTPTFFVDGVQTPTNELLNTITQKTGAAQPL